MIVLAALLLPYVRFSGEHDQTCTIFDLRSWLFQIKLDGRRKLLTGRMFFFFHWKIELSQPTDPVEQHPADDPLHIDKEIETAQPVEQPPEPTPKRKPSRKRAPKRKSGSISMTTKHLWSERTLIRRLVKQFDSAMKRFFSAVKIDLFALNIMIATPDPMATGIIFGALIPLTALNRPPNRTLSFQIDFQQDRPSFDISCIISIRPIRLIYIGVIELFRLPWWRIWKVYRMIRAEKAKSIH